MPVQNSPDQIDTASGKCMLGGIDLKNTTKSCLTNSMEKIVSQCISSIKYQSKINAHSHYKIITSSFRKLTFVVHGLG